VERRLSELQQLSRLGASLLEAELPPIDRRVLERRSLVVVGRASGRSADARDVRLHVLPAAVDRQLGWMPDTWVDPKSGAVVDRGWSLLAGAFVADQAVDALPRGQEGIVTLRLLLRRPACIDALPLLEHSDRRPRLWSCSSRDHARTRW
jgi:hypothetical protein